MHLRYGFIVMANCNQCSFWFKKCKSHRCVKSYQEAHEKCSFFLLKNVLSSTDVFMLFWHIINSLETHKTCHSIITWTCKLEISHPKSSSDEDSDHKSRRETVRGDVPCFAFPWTSFERKKELESDILIWL